MTQGRKRLLEAGGVGLLVILYFVVVGRLQPDFTKAVHVTKMVVGALAAAAVFYERSREGERRPVSERWKRFAGITLAVVSVALYFNAFKLGYQKWYHRHDQYHYYMGSKYFPELGYDRLYRCTVIAEDELGVVRNDRGQTFDLSKEARHGDRKVRDLGNTNLLIPAAEVLEDPASCKSHFTNPARWDAFKKDVQFFRFEADKNYWHGMQKDHGYNPPPVWTLIGKQFASLAPASVPFMQFLGALDVVYMLGMLAAVWWAFGWRVFAVAAIVWGCEGAGDPYYWTGGAFLRQDWLFFTVFAVCLARKRYYALAAASLVHATLLRIFPGLLVVGWLVTAGWYVARHKRLAPHHLRMLIGGTVAAVVLVGASIAVVGKDSYKQFYSHTIVVHDRTPLTNHMGLRVVIAHKPGTGIESGRMKYTKDDKLVDPFQVWKDMRVQRYHKYRWIAYALIGATFLAFVYVLRRVKSPWIAQGLSCVFVILGSQLTNYYYGFLVCAVPLIRIRKDFELAFFGYVILTQVVYLYAYWNDDKYTMQTLLGLLLSYGFIGALWPRKGAEQRAHKELGAARGEDRERATAA